MTGPTGTPLTGDIWHLSIEDLLAPLPEKTRLGGPGPFVINLSASSAPIDLPPKGFVDCQRGVHVYQVQRMEDRRPRYRLRVGPFASEDDADAVLLKVRDLYPSALTATADADDLRAIAGLQAKSPTPTSPPLASEKPADRLAEKQILAEKSPARPALQAAVKLVVPTLVEVVDKPAIAAVARPVAAEVAKPTLAAAVKPAVAEAAKPVITAAVKAVVAEAMKPAIAATVKAAVAEVAKPPLPAITKSAVAEVTKPAVAATAKQVVAAAVKPPVPATPKPALAEVAKPIVAAAAKPIERPAASAADKPAEKPVPRAAAFKPTEKSPASAAPVPPAPTLHDKHVPSLESTQTIRALTQLELEDDEASRWFAIQLALSEEPFDPETLPNLDIFSVYRLYSVAGIEQGRIVHVLRLGFFTDQIAAGAVASYLGAFYEKPSTKRVSSAERERFADESFEARKDVGATGRQAVIEITNERYIREKRMSQAAAK